jgi:hypothetical protein
MVIDRLRKIAPARLTLDFDGSVQSTKRHAEGTAVGYCKKKKGARSYYPLFCTIAQTLQVFDFLHRSGNVHDSNGAKAFILACIDSVQAALPQVKLEVRMDSAFFSDEIVRAIEARGVEFTLSVPFERFGELKKIIEQRRRWRPLDVDTWYFETSWKPQCWDKRFRFLFIRTRAKKQQKDRLAESVVLHSTATSSSDYHEQMLSAEGWQTAKDRVSGVFGELKSHCHQDYVPVQTLCGNQVYLLAGLFAYNLTRELQMQTTAPCRPTTANRASLWVFERIDTLRKGIVQRAGRLTHPEGILTLTISANAWIKSRILHTLGAIQSEV